MSQWPAAIRNDRKGYLPRDSFLPLLLLMCREPLAVIQSFSEVLEPNLQVGIALPLLSECATPFLS